MKHIFRYILLAFLPVVGFAQPAVGYYNSTLDGKNGRDLELALTAIIYPHTHISYDDLWTAFETTDVVPDSLRKDPSRTDQVYDMYAWINRLPKYYSDNDHTQTGGINREHCVPNSWWGGKDGNNIAYTDLHHLVPSDGAANSAAKSDYPLGEYATGMTLGWPTAVATNSQSIIYAYPDNNHTQSASHRWDIPTNMQSNYGGAQHIFEPADEYKGDFARMYFYVVCAYEGNITWLNSVVMFTSDANNHTTIQPWALALLLKWHRQDPVSDKELARNNAVDGIQHNRNPFIDYPELIEYIWGNMSTQSFSLNNATCAYSTNYASNSSTAGYAGNDTHTVTFYNEGAEYATRNCYQYEEINFPANPTSQNMNYVFVGWSETAVANTDTRPTLLRHDVMGTNAKTYHAVYALATGSETWTEVTTAPADGTYAILSGKYFLRAATYGDRIANGYFRPEIVGNTLAVAPEEDCIWEITNYGDTYYRIQNGTNYLASSAAKKASLSTNPANDITKWSIGYIGNQYTFINFDRNQSSSNKDTKYLRNNGENGWAAYTSGTGSAPRLFRKVGNITYTDYTSITATSVAIGTAGWTTYSAPYNYTVDQPAYKATVNGTTITIEQVNPNDEIIPAGAGILIGRSEDATTATITPTLTAATANMTGNDLLGTATATYEVQPTDYIYCLTKNSNEFNRVNAGVTIPLHKAYFALGAVPSAPLRVVMPEDVPTGLEQTLSGSSIKGKCVKALVHGKLVLVRNGKMFDINGNLVK